LPQNNELESNHKNHDTNQTV